MTENTITDKVLMYLATTTDEREQAAMAAAGLTDDELEAIARDTTASMLDRWAAAVEVRNRITARHG